MRKMFLLVAAGFAVCFIWLGYQRWDYWRSPQYKLDKLVASGQINFLLREVFGSDWQALCFFPASYTYQNNADFEKWLPEALGRAVLAEEYMQMQRDGSGIAVLTKPRGKQLQGLDGAPWQIVKEQKVICTSDPAALVTVVHDKSGYKGDYWRGYWLEHHFEKIYQLHI